MKRVFVLIALLLLSASISPAAALPDVRSVLRIYEQNAGLDSQPKTESEALAQLDLELNRDEFARSVELYAEGILAMKEVEKAHIDYEKALVKRAAKLGKLKQVLAEIARQRAQIARLTVRERVAGSDEYY